LKLLEDKYKIKKKEIQNNESELEKARQDREELEKDNKGKTSEIASIKDSIEEKRKRKEALQNELQVLKK